MEQTTPEQIALASSPKRRASSTTAIEVSAEGARSTSSSEARF